MKDSMKIVTLVLELTDEATIEQLMDLYKNSTYIHGARIRAVYDGDLPELLCECETNYSELLEESSQ